MTVECVIEWQENDTPRSAAWRSANGSSAPARVLIADDTMNADRAYKLACEGTALLWRGDFQNARLLLQALARRCDAGPRAGSRKARSASRTAGKSAAASAEQGTAPATAKSKSIFSSSAQTGQAGQAEQSAQAFYRHRQAQGQRARILGMLLIPFDADYAIPLRRAPDVRLACEEAYGPAPSAFIMSLRELLGVIGAHEWRSKGVEVTALEGRIHPYYGVYSPVRGEYIDLVAQAPMPAAARTLAFDIGTGSGVLAALLAKRGVKRIVATDNDARALACAAENLDRLGYAQQVNLLEADLFPAGRAPLVVCNPPWLPATPTSAIERAVYDPGSRMLRGFLAGLAGHLTPGGEGWLILSDLAEHLGLRSAAQLAQWIDESGLRVIARIDIKPRHPRAGDAADPLHAARAAETTSLWRLAALSKEAP